MSHGARSVTPKRACGRAETLRKLSPLPTEASTISLSPTGRARRETAFARPDRRVGASRWRCGSRSDEIDPPSADGLATPGPTRRFTHFPSSRSRRRPVHGLGDTASLAIRFAPVRIRPRGSRRFSPRASEGRTRKTPHAPLPCPEMRRESTSKRQQRRIAPGEKIDRIPQTGLTRTRHDFGKLGWTNEPETMIVAESLRV